MFRTAIPLALGQLLQYGEWEVLTVFVAALGTAEVTAWGIAGELWVSDKWEVVGSNCSLTNGKLTPTS